MLRKKGGQGLLTLGQHGGKFLNKQGHLFCQQREKPDQGQGKTGHEQNGNNNNRDFSLNFKPFKPLDNAFQKIGDDDADENRNQHGAPERKLLKIRSGVKPPG